jgi:hypothetical protein
MADRVPGALLAPPAAGLTFARDRVLKPGKAGRES